MRGVCDGGLSRDDADACLTRAEHGRGLGERAGADDVHHQVVGELVVGARIVLQLLGSGGFVGIDEARSTTPRTQRRADDRVDADRADVVEREAAASHSFAVGPGAE